MFFPQTAFAQYVLPYPSVMPGGIWYKAHIAWENLLTYWYYGDLGQFEYSLKESDMYLVQAKTLFEYQQYLLGYQALEKSNVYFSQTLPHLLKAQKDGKNISLKRQILSLAARSHLQVLSRIGQLAPARFYWQAEKSLPVQLDIHDLIQKSSQLTNTYL